MSDRRRRPFDVLVAVVAIVAVLWLGYWYAANQLSFAALRYAISKAGNGSNCGTMTSAGFPLKLDIGCKDLRIASRDASLQLGGVSATAPLYWPLSFQSSLAGPLTVTRPGDAPLTLTWRTASSAVSAGFGGLKRAAASAEGLSLTGDLDMPRLPLSGITAEAAEVTLAPAPGATPDYQLALKVSGVHPQAADRRELPPVAIDGEALLADVGNSLGFDPRRALRDWARRGGKLHLGRLALSAGPVAASGSGDLTLSPEGALAGKVVVRFTKLEELPAVVEALQPGSRTAATIAKLLLAVTRKVETEAGPAREATLNLGGGFISVGIVPIAAIPPIRF